MKGCCKSTVLPGRLAGDTSAVWYAWQRWLPSFLMPMVRELDELTAFQGEGDLALMPNEMMRCKKHLVVTLIDMCSQHLHIW